MIDPQNYSGSVNNGQAEPRMAGYVPVAGQQKAAEAQNFSQLMQKAADSDPAARTANSAGSSSAQGKHHGFLDFLTTLFDIINPLEHLPIISTIYEHVTGHHMNPVARIAGDTLYGGPIGTVVGVANVISEKKTGKDIGDNMIAMLTGHKDKGKAAPDIMVAQNTVKAANIVWNDAPSAPAAPDASTALASAAPAGLPNVAPAAGADLSLANALAASPAAPASVPKAQPAPLKQNFPSLAAQQSHSAKATGKTLADYAASRSLPAFDAKNRTPAALDAQEKTASALQAGSTPGSSVQNAPADAAPSAVPPGLIAQRMMEGLDKYAAMEKVRMSPSYTGTF